MASESETVTLPRAEYEHLLEALSDARAIAADAICQAKIDRVGWDAFRADCLTGEEFEQIMDGASPVRIWREKRGLTQRGLALEAEISPSYLSEIESGLKPGSTGAIHRLAKVLRVQMEDLVLEPAA